ncbi:MAG: hypothetical protein JSS49_03995 [Planctomycetes bacterium]|nr:hypothetical protein [Planctomycetota bacterium]
MSQQSSSRFWLVVGLFLSLNTVGLIWIRHAWAPRRHQQPVQLVTLDVTPAPSQPGLVPTQPEPGTDDESSVIEPTAIVVPKPAVPKVIEPAKILAWLPVSNAASAVIPENVVPAATDDEDQFDSAERILAVFDRPIVEEADLNRPLEHAPFQLSPSVPGHWRWTSLNRLAFVLDHPLPPGRKFELDAAVDFTELMHFELAPASRRFLFQSRRLEWLGMTLLNRTRNSVTFEMAFNQPVSPADLLRAMTESGEDPIDKAARHVMDATVLTKEASSKLVVTTKALGATLRIHLASTLTGAGADLKLGLVPDRELPIPTTFAFVRSDLQSASLDEESTVRLYFSNGLSADQEKPTVKVTPAVPDMFLEFTPGPGTYYAGLVLRGKFQCGQRYSVMLPKTLLSQDGQTLGDTSPIIFETPHRPADLSISATQGILIPDGNLTLDVKCVNISGVRLSASRLHANNLSAFLQGRNDTATMRSIVQERMRSVELPQDTPQTIALDLKQLLSTENAARPDGKAGTVPLTGIYRIAIADANEYWNRDMATVAITDLGLTAKRGRDGWLVWALSLRSAQPQSGVIITARSFNNQVLAQSTTDATGIASLNIPENHPDGTVWLLTAEQNGDLNYLIPDRHSWVVDNVDQSGRPWPQNYEAMVYTERGVYRPGDTVRLTGILRDRLGHRPPAFPLSVKVTRPDGRVVSQLNCMSRPDQQGMFQVDYPSSEASQTGTYRFDVAIPGSTELLGSVSAQIEAFVPIRIAVQAESTKPRHVKAPPEIRAAAKYLFGQPAADLNVTVLGMWQRIPFTAKEYPDHQFGDFSGRNQQQLPEVSRTLDANGECQMSLALPQDDRPGIWMSNVTTSVTEAGGRSVSTTCRVEVDTCGLHIGVKAPERKVVVVGEPSQFDWVLLDDQGVLAEPHPIKVNLVRVDYDTTVVQVNGRPVWRSIERLIESKSRLISSDDPANHGSLNLTCDTAGRYRLRLSDPQSGAATQTEFYASTHRSDRVDVPLQQPEQLELVLDQSKYRPGDTARVLVRSPFPGQMLLTIEGDRVHEHRIVTLETNSQLIEVPLPADLRGGAYVTATVIRAIDHQLTDWLPHRACGVARLVMDPSLRELPVELKAASTALPGSVLKVRAQLAWAADASEGAKQIAELPPKPVPVIHIWAVDEGILLTTRYTTPNPLNFFHKPRKPGVSSADIYSSLLPDYLRPVGMTRIGADRGDAADFDVDNSRRSPVESPRRTPAVVWHSVQPVGADGSLTLDFAVPQLTGTLRLMAVAVDGDRYGSTEQPVLVTSPLLVESSWPRTAAPNDKFRVPVKLFNTTSAPLEVLVSTDVSGPVVVKPHGVTIQLTGVEPGVNVGLGTTVTVEPGKPFLQWLDVTGKGLGAATIRIDAQAKGTDGVSLRAFTEHGLAVRSATPLDSETTFTRHPVGEVVNLPPPVGFIPGTTRTSLAISSLPSAELNPALDALIDYPYGCGEQTSSRLYALVAAQNWLASNTSPDVDVSRQQFVNQLIDAGIVRLWSMQNRGGGIGYWDHAASHPWVSTYAAGAIIAARDAGRPVDAAFVADLAKYLESVLDGPASLDDNTRAFICDILAALNKPKQGWMSRLSDNLDALDAEGRAHLASAWMHLGRKDRAVSVLPDDTFRLTATTAASGRLTSRVRQDAVLLKVMLELDPKHPAIPPLVDRLQSSRKKQVWMSTLENAAAISALARYRSAGSVESDFTGTLQQGELQKSFSHLNPLHERATARPGPMTIASQGKGEFFIVRTTEGLREQALTMPYDRQLKVRREWLDREDRPVDPTKLRVGDLVYVRIRVSAPGFQEAIPNVAIVDALPGGVEIENPRLATSATTNNVVSAEPDHVEFLDDRAVLFSSVTGNDQSFRYAVRVTTPGDFEWPPIQASSMYDSAFASVHGGGRVIVYTREEEIHEVAERPGEDATNRR